MYGLRIRAAVPEDSESISKLLCGLVEKFIAKELSLQGRDFLLSTMTVDAISLNIQSGYRYHVAEVKGLLTGVIAVRGNAHLYHLFVAEQFHRKGIAKKLWQLAMNECLRDGNTGEFTVNSSAYALGVYKKLGFVVQSGPREKYGVVFYPMKLIVQSQL
ncbi:MAG: GNAT family N-acetyltransferase [Xanthomonadales bacterium]|nr:GNAT family N-acetyltransferase [Xanthomonadales bacterium]